MYATKTPDGYAVERNWVLKYIEHLEMDSIAGKLLQAPEDIAQAQHARLLKAQAVKERQEDLDMVASLLEMQVMSDPALTNDAKRKAALKQAQGRDPEYRRAVHELDKAQADLDMADIEIKRREQVFWALRSVNEAVTARVLAVSK